MTNNYTIMKTLIGSLLRKGNRYRAEKIFKKMLVTLKTEYNDNPYTISYNPIQFISPNINVKPQRLGGVIYNMPYIITEQQQLKIAVHWIIDQMKKNSDYEFEKRFFKEIIEIYKCNSKIINKKDEMHETGFTNRAFFNF